MTIRVRGLWLTWVLLICADRSPGSLVAEFDQKGLRGQVGFLEAPDGKMVVAASLKGTMKGEAFVWKVYTTPVLPYEACAPDNYGAVLLDLSSAHGLLEGESVVVVGHLELWRLLDRPLVLKSLSTLRVVCAALTPAAPAPATTYVAHFVAGLAGRMLFRQVELQRVPVTGVRVSLAAVSPGVSAATLAWSIFARKHEADEESLGHMRDACASLGPFPGSMVHEALEPIPRGQGGGRGRRHYQLERLPDLNALIRKGALYVVLYDGERVAACSRLTRPAPRRATAVFTPRMEVDAGGGVAGQVEMYQVSPLDPVKLTVNLTVPHGNAAAFGIDNFSSGGFFCSGLSRRFYEPWSVDLDLTPVPRQGTKDLYPAGDLSGKFGTLHGLKLAVATLLDPTITLFGQHSVLGHAVAVYDPGWRVLGCAELRTRGRAVQAVAHFTGNITGEVRLTQLADSLFAETTVYLRLRHTEGQDTIGHPWQVHEEAAISGSDCTYVGASFDPFAIGLAERDAVNREPSHAAFRVGDLQGKHGRLDIPGRWTIREDSSSIQYQWTDEWLPLTGPKWASVVGRALVLHHPRAQASAVSCANIRLEKNMELPSA